MISLHTEENGIATLIFDPKTHAWTQGMEQAFAHALQKVITDAKIQGVVIAIQNCEGPWYEELLSLNNEEEALRAIQNTQNIFRALETSGKPVAVAISGSVLGRGLELALAGHYRVIANNPHSKVGLPDIRFGLVPGAGGVQRLARKIGLQAAASFLLTGQMISAEEVVKLGIIEKLVKPEEVLAHAKQWLLSKPDATKLWDKKGFQLPGGEVSAPANQQFFSMSSASLRKQTWGNFAGRDYLLSSLYEGLQVPFVRAQEIEAKYFVQSVLSNTFKSSVKTLFFARQKAIQLAKRPANIPVKNVKTLGILGAGMMGAGIALVAAERGIKVILMDVSQAAAEKGKAFAKQKLKEADWNRITTTTDYALLKDCDLVIEAVIEDRKIKADVTKKVEAVVSKDAFLASNTSTLPITSLAKPLVNQERFIGLHFFSPVERMPLLEIIVGEKTSQQTLAHALDFAKQMGKTPIVVNDGRGFFTSRVFEQYVLEGMAMLQEGVDPVLIENAARLAGMPVGPLALADEVSLSLIHQILKQTREDLGKSYKPHEAEEVVEQFVKKFDRPGKKAGKGFYDYPVGGKKELWPDLAKHYPVAKEQPDLELLKYRLLLIQSLESVKSMEEGVITDAVDADLGSILGLGFPPFTGGVIAYLQQLGYKRALEVCGQLEKECSKRFKAPKLLKDWAKTA